MSQYNGNVMVWSKKDFRDWKYWDAANSAVAPPGYTPQAPIPNDPYQTFDEATQLWKAGQFPVERRRMDEIYYELQKIDEASTIPRRLREVIVELAPVGFTGESTNLVQAQEASASELRAELLTLKQKVGDIQ